MYSIIYKKSLYVQYRLVIGAKTCGLSRVTLQMASAGTDGYWATIYSDLLCVVGKSHQELLAKTLSAGHEALKGARA